MEANQSREENDMLKQFAGLLGQQGMGEQSKDFTDLFRYVAAMQIQLTVMTGELQGVREQLSMLQENQHKTVRERLAARVEHFQGEITGLSEGLATAKSNLSETASRAAGGFRAKGKAAMCRIIQKGIPPVRQMLTGCREQVAYMMADCQKTANWLDSVGSEMKQIGDSASNLGRLLSGKGVKEAQEENQGVGLTRAANKALKNIMAGLQKIINLAGRALKKLDRFSSRLEHAITEAEKGERASVKDKLLETKMKAEGQHKEMPEQAKDREMCM